MFTHDYMVSSIVIYCLHTVKWLHLLLSNTNSSIWTQLNVFNNLIQFNINHLFAESNVNVEAAPPHYPKLQDWSLIIRWFSVISRTLIACACVWRVLFLCKDAVGIFYSPSQLGWCVVIRDSKWRSNFKILKYISILFFS